MLSVVAQPMLLLPLHVVFLELIIDPACSVALESEREDPNSMRRPPRRVQKPLFDRRTLVFSILQGAGVLAVTAVVLARALLGGLPESDTRVLTFVTLIVADIGLILTNRNISGPTLAAVRVFNPALWLVVAGALALLVAAVASAALRDLFRFGELHFDDIALVVIASAIALLWLDVLRFVRARVLITYEPVQV